MLSRTPSLCAGPAVKLPYTDCLVGLAAILSATLAAVGSVSATEYADEFCSKGFDQPARLASEGTGYKLTVGEKTEHFEMAGSVGTGLAGLLLAPRGGEGLEVLYGTEIGMDTNQTPPEVVPVLIFRDRVFWPCDR